MYLCVCRCRCRGRGRCCRVLASAACVGVAGSLELQLCQLRKGAQPEARRHGQPSGGGQQSQAAFRNSSPKEDDGEVV